VTRITLLILFVVMSLFVLTVNAAESWRCRLEINRANLPDGLHIVRSHFEGVIQFDGDNFWLVPVGGDIVEGFHITKNTNAELSGVENLRRNGAGRKTLILDKRRRTVEIISKRANGEIAYAETGVCFGP